MWFTTAEQYCDKFINVLLMYTVIPTNIYTINNTYRSFVCVREKVKTTGPIVIGFPLFALRWSVCLVINQWTKISIPCVITVVLRMKPFLPGCLTRLSLHSTSTYISTAENTDIRINKENDKEENIYCITSNDDDAGMQIVHFKNLRNFLVTYYG